jgi:hypothetical protein
MKRFGGLGLLVLAVLLLRPAPASADLTGFLGVSSTPSSRSAKGIAIGVGMVLVGFEFEYARISEDEVNGAPELTTGMGNVVVMTPSFKMQLYGTTGGGIFHERWRDFTNNGFGTNVGGGLKVALAGPIRLRVDYRIFNLRGTPITKSVHRFYTGVSLSF